MIRTSTPSGGPATPEPPLFRWVDEANRQLTICNACRYCETYCPVFPALERRTTLADVDVVSLANLCHDCQACYQACMYVPPHEFGVNLPAALSAVRKETYAHYAWPARVAGRFQRHAFASLGLVFLALIILTISVSSEGSWGHFFTADVHPGAFYRIIPFLGMLIPALAGGVFILVVLGAGFLRFWRASGASASELFSWPAWRDATSAALRLTHMRGGGNECYYPTPFRPSATRRRLHFLVMWGFVATFISTCLAAIWQDLLHTTPPFAVLSAPVLFGILGGVALIVGTSGLIRLKFQSGADATSTAMRSMDLAFLATLNAVSITGMLTLILRDTAVLGVSLDVHLACLFALYVTAPYGKFVHFVYRFAAILQDAVERLRSPVLQPLADED